MKRRESSRAFTIVELIMVIAVIGILAALTVIGIGSWRESVAKTEVKSDLASLQAGMEDARNRMNAYPIFPSGTIFDGSAGTGDIFTQSSGVILSYAEGDAEGYCVDAQSRSNPSVRFFYNSREGVVQTGDCSGLPEIIASQPCSSIVTLTSGQGSWQRIQYAGGKIYGQNMSNYNQLWRYDGEVTKAHEGGGWYLFGARGNTVYGVNWDGSGIWQYDGTAATQIASASALGEVHKWQPSTATLAADGSIYIAGDSGPSSPYNQLWRYSGGIMEKLVGPSGAWYGMKVAADGMVYGTNSSGTQLWRYSGGAAAVVATGSRWLYFHVGPDNAVYGTNVPTGKNNSLWKYSQANGTEQLASTGAWWALVFDSATGAIYGSSSDSVNSSGSLWRYQSGTPTQLHSGLAWQSLRFNPKNGTIYGLNDNKSRLNQYKDGSVTEVAQAVRTMQDILVAPDGSLYISDGSSPFAAGNYTLRRYRPAC